MKNNPCIILLLVLALLLFGCNNNGESNKPYLIMVSLDGFRWDYTQYAHTPVLDSLSRVGVVAESLIPAFPTSTFPNHFTMATGLYPDNHGIVLNGFYADDLKSDYNKGDKSTVTDERFYIGEPIWATAELQGTKAATLFWVGSEAETKGVRPTISIKYNHLLPFKARIDSVYTWLSLPETNRPHLIMWYLHEPDGVGHTKGPLSEGTINVIEKLDSFLGDFFTRMRKLPIFDQLNFIITSDHGMGPISVDRQIILDKIIDTADLVYFDGGNPIWNLKVKDGRLKDVYSNLKKNQNLQVWHKDRIPERLHYGTNPRIHDITLVAKPYWSVFWSWRIYNGLGAHGYDNSFKDMHAIFYAAGPAFKENYVAPEFENIHIYSLIAEIMELKPAQTDGNLNTVENLLIKEDY